jgi:dTDP-4-amino-4,6-dideoxygalactose transaminase
VESKYCVSFNSGTDALTLALHLLGVKKGDEVITTPNSFIASTSVIIHLGAKPVFVDVQDDQNIDPKLIEKKITSKTKAIMPVHLSGRVCQMDEIIKLCKKKNIKLIEDAAQAIGSKYKKRLSGTFGEIGCFSAHPLKNLNAIGDSGFFVTNSKNIYNLATDLKNHGMTNRNIINHFGYVSRMDNLQAAILDYRLKKLPNIIQAKKKKCKTIF